MNEENIHVKVSGKLNFVGSVVDVEIEATGKEARHLLEILLTL